MARPEDKEYGAQGTVRWRYVRIVPPSDARVPHAEVAAGADESAEDRSARRTLRRIEGPPGFSAT